MGNQLKEDWVYAIADALNIPIEYRKAENRLTGSGKIRVDLGVSKVEVNARIVSSLFNKTCYMIMVRVIGNLALLVCAGEEKGSKVKPAVSVHLLNLAKMSRIEDWLETHLPRTPAEAKKLLDKAIVKSFVKDGLTSWR